MDDRSPDSSRVGPLAWLVLIATVVVVASAILGGQVSSVLSTTGSPLTPPVGRGEAPFDGAAPGRALGGASTATGTAGSTGGQAPAGASGSPAVPGAEQLIVKTGSIALRVADIDASVREATRRVRALGGELSASRRSGADAALTADLTFRLPSERWDDALTAVRSMPGDLLAEDTGTEDVTSQVVDLGARIRNLQATEAALQSIMDRAAAIPDVLTVQEQLTETRGSIEELVAREAMLREQASRSTLSVEFTSEPDPLPAVQPAGYDPGAEAEKATERLVRIVQRAVTAGIWFGIVWLPVLLALAATVATAAFIALFVLRRVRRLRGGESGGPPATTPPSAAAA